MSLLETIQNMKIILAFNTLKTIAQGTNQFDSLEKWTPSPAKMDTDGPRKILKKLLQYFFLNDLKMLLLKCFLKQFF
jgi:hypothetical protein